MQPLKCLQRARLDPRVVYEETILRDGLFDAQVLFLPQCRFLSQPVVERIREFQSRGGVLVADKELMNGLKADIEIPVVRYDPFPRTDKPDDVDAMMSARHMREDPHGWTRESKERMCAIAEDLRCRLEPHYVADAGSSSPELVTYSRRWNGTRYLFVVNDNRTFGDYFGPYGLTMEKGLPFSGEVFIAEDAPVEAVYELSRGEQVPFQREGGRIVVPVDFDTNDGRMFIFLPNPVAVVDVEAPAMVERGGEIAVTMTVRDKSGAPVPALLPVEIRLYDAEGREIDGGGWFCAEDGVARATFITNLDDPGDGWRVVCRDRASGLLAETLVAPCHRQGATRVEAGAPTGSRTPLLRMKTSCPNR